MYKFNKVRDLLVMMAVILIVLPFTGSKVDENIIFSTRVSIRGDKWYFNDSIVNKGTPAEGLLMNVRMVNSVFEDRGNGFEKIIPVFDPMANTEAFIRKIPEYVSCGVNAFTISLQGGTPGYEGAINSAFEADGTLHAEYMNRIAMVIKACNEHGVVVILSCFYQRQHSHISALNGKEAISNAFDNTVKWVKENHFRNVVLEVSNEYRHGGYRNWTDGNWLISEKGQIELIKRAKSLHPSLLVSTSGMGDGIFHDSLANAVDFITIHFNNTSIDNYEKRIETLKKYGKPIICNEDDKLREIGVNALVLSVLNGCGWGYMNSKQNQSVPFRFEGKNDDTAVYNMMRKVTSPGAFPDKSLYKQPSIIITFPKDGDIFRVGQKIELQFSHLFPDTSKKHNIYILSNNIQIGVINDNTTHFSWQLKESGIFILEASVNDLEGKELLRSSKVDIIVQKNGHN